MSHLRVRRFRSLSASRLALLAGAAAVGVAGLTSGRPNPRFFEPVVGAWVLPGMTYTGDASCSSAACHGSDEARMQSGQMIGDESTIWATRGEGGDPHAMAWKTLQSADSKAIAAKLGLGAAAESQRCLSCHAINAPAPQRGEKFNLQSGVSCEACHGPAEKYLQPHAEAGWTQKQRKSADATTLLRTHGLFDTSNLALRAELCVSCHLQIDKDMLDAGHPPLRFEMYGHNSYFFDDIHTIHWDEPKGQLITARQWAVGQAAGADAARRQVSQWKAKGWDTAPADALVAMYDRGLSVAKKHFGADSPAGLAAAAYTPQACAAAAQDLAALAPGAASQLERKVIVFGVMALAEATYDARNAEPPDALFDAFDIAAAGAEGQEYLDAVKTIADLAK